MTPTPTPGASSRPASAGYQTASDQPPADSDGPADSGGYQTASDQPARLEQPPGVDAPPDDGDDRMDPYEAFAKSTSKAADVRRREKERRDPALWLPGADDLDQDLGPPDQETGFSPDRWRRGNPQVSVRLRPMDFERLRRAADLYGVRPTTLARMMVIRGVRAILDAELQKSGEEFRDRGRF